MSCERMRLSLFENANPKNIEPSSLTVRNQRDSWRRASTRLLGALVATTFWMCQSAGAASSPPPMTVPGQFNVSATGAATYSIPVSVPPGTGGLVPVLSLDYSSQSGDGIVGLGWMLSGLESIERCSRTYAQDGVHGGVNYDTNDRFCFEGHRLLAISGSYGADGTQYRTEVETFSKVVSYGSQGSGPVYFRVWTKSGQIMEFGNTSDSRALTTDGSNTARSWALNKVSDVKGNYFTVSYVNDATNGQVYPSRIDYTGNGNTSLSPYNSVRFVYNTARADSVMLYHAGSFTQTTALLTNIQAYASSSLVYDYRLNYEAGSTTRQARLTSVTLCDGNNNCLKPTNFGWQGSRDNFSVTTSTISGQFSGASPSNSIFADFNGDGITDALKTSTSAPTGSGNLYEAFTLLIGNGSGGSTATTLTSNYPRMGQPNGAPSIVGILDTNGDGIADFTIVQPYLISSGVGWMPLYVVWVETNNGDSTASSNVKAFAGVQSCCNYNTFQNIAGDFDGSGRTTFTSAYNATQLTDGMSVNVGDFDGDGCSDILTQMSSDHAVKYSCNPAVSSVSVSYWSGSKLVLGDFNGDGMTDILVIPPSGSGTLYLSTGKGFVASSYSVPASWAGAGNGNSISGSHVLLTSDWNGDGKTDIAEVTTTAINYYVSTGNGFVLVASQAISWDGAYHQLADLNNDGIPDILLGDTAYSISYTPEFMNSVSNGLGATTSITYDRLNKNGSFYTKCPNNPSSYVCGDTYPTQAVDGPMYVVSRVASSNGIGGNFSTTYAYAGYKSDLRGRGSLGFAQVTATSLQSGVAETTTYHQDFPYVGQPSTRTSSLSGATLRAVSNTYANANLGTSTEGVPRFFVGLTQSVETANDTDLSPLPATTTAFHFDCQDNSTCYGNLLTSNESVSLSGTVRSTKATTNTYWNDPNNWFIGRVTGTTVTRTNN
ncbi:MAG: FG-GAP-like repeat-containing protein [Rhizomicrobium sp.]|nr:FG-GAP-like repeat-containing protein [Rhizomicrobium sp.]